MNVRLLQKSSDIGPAVGSRWVYKRLHAGRRFAQGFFRALGGVVGPNLYGMQKIAFPGLLGVLEPDTMDHSGGLRCLCLLGRGTLQGESPNR